jgi:uncharacterized protein YjbJ (UPF0337 family)
MDKDRIAGAAHRVKGTVKETVGKLTGDAKTQAEGAAEKAAGKVQNIVGGAKDAVRDTVKKSILLPRERGCPRRHAAYIAKVDMTGRIRAHSTGGKYGPRNPALVVGCTHSDNHPARSDLALSKLNLGEREW